MSLARPDTDDLLGLAAVGDADARDRLLDRHRDRLLRMVAVRLDPRLAPRVDPSDVVQDVLVEADRRLDGYLADRPLPFFAWLRQLAADRIGMAHRRHLRAARRSVRREEPAGLPDASAEALAGRLLDSATGPVTRAQREEQRARVRAALERLAGRDREVLTLRYLEQLATAEVAELLEVSEAAVKMRLLRAVQRLHDLVQREDRS